ncbi:MAG: hypothetical protein ACRDTG_13195, partial [Pseudonocardiaceae bacterium]
MILFPNIASADSNGQHRARARLVALHGTPRPTSDVTALDIAAPDTADPDNADPDPTDPDDEDASPAAAREGRLVRRWVPASLRDARWEPGRPGALMLSLVAALA